MKWPTTINTMIKDAAVSITVSIYYRNQDYMKSKLTHTPGGTYKK